MVSVTGILVGPPQPLPGHTCSPPSGGGFWITGGPTITPRGPGGTWQIEQTCMYCGTRVAWPATLEELEPLVGDLVRAYVDLRLAQEREVQGGVVLR